MCAILGHLAFNPKHRLLQSDLSDLNDLMTHRGPDSAGIYSEGPVTLATRRLAIIDIPGGVQPMRSKDNRYIIAFNGEIYNYKEIRKDLIERGFPIQTNSDTEVLLYSYIDAGPECLSRLNGMFAFAIWDKEQKSLFLARDRLGVKPLYYACDDKRLLFSSEITPIHRSGLFELEINKRSVVDLLAYWYICDPQTIFKDVQQLPPAHYMLIQGGKTRLHRWWEVPSNPERDIGFGDACDEFKSIFNDAVRLRLQSDVPVGTLLSGGIDSGLVTSESARILTSPVQCFSFDFKEETYSELALAQKTAAQLPVDLIPVSLPKMDPDLIDEIFMSFDEPFGNASFIPTYLLFKEASQKVSVILTGDGSDELLGGYPTYQSPYYQRLYNVFPEMLWSGVSHLVKMLPVSHDRISFDYRLRQFLRGAKLSPERAHASWREVFGIEEQMGILRPEVISALGDYDPFENFQESFSASTSMDMRNRFMHADISTYLVSDHLRKIDRMSMAHSVEARQPFLDYRMVEFAMSLPAEHKTTIRKTKRILREISKPFLPLEVVRGQKKGLTSPIAHWIANDLRSYVGDRLQGGLLKNYFNPDSIQQLFTDHINRKRDNSRLIWSLLSLQIWGEKMRVTN